MADKKPLASMTDEELYEWFQQNKQSLISDDQQQRLEDYDEDRKEQYRELYSLSKLTGLSIDTITQMRPDELAIAVEVAKEPKRQQQAGETKFDASKFSRRQKTLAIELNENDGWVSFDEFAVLCNWSDGSIIDNAEGLILRFNETAAATKQPARVVRHNNGFLAEKI